MEIPYGTNSEAPVTARVNLNYAADVFLVDEINLNRYQSGQQFEYFGGHFDQTPVTVTSGGPGTWYLIVDDGGSGSQYEYSFL